MPQEYYERLGVDPDASESEIKTAFRQRIKETHPDVSDDEAASDRTKRLIEAKDVLTDPTERQRYDRLGHEAYVSDRDPSGVTEGSDDAQTSADSGENRTERRAGSRERSRPGAAAESSASGAHRRDSWTQQETTQQSSNSGDSKEHNPGQATGSTAERATNWYDSSRRQQSTPHANGNYRAWEADQSYAVGDSANRFSLRELFTSQRAIALLGTTFVIYPVLLFGALFQPFPTAVNLTVAMCIVLVIAFMQSVPQVAILVFGIWTVLLPIILFGFLGVSVLSVQGVLSLAAVTFPLGLSVLTWIALDQTKR